MIKILDTNRVGVIKNVVTASRLEEINGENVLDFTAVLDEKLNSLITQNSMFELNDEYFDTALLKKSNNEDGTYTVEVESEHVSYRLNNPDYNVEYFTEHGTPTYILGKILEGTPFTVGVVEFTDIVTYSAQEAKSRRQLLMEFIAYIGGEGLFNKFQISIVQHRGSTTAKPVIKDRNVKVIAKSINKRELDENGDPKVSYICEPVHIPLDNYSLGDDVVLLQKTLGIKEILRVVSINRNPYDDMDTIFQFANYVNGLENSLYRIATYAVAKDALYNGIRIGPEFGFEAVRNDKKARAYFRSDGMKFQSGDGSGGNWKDRLYYEYDSEKDETVLVFDGLLTTKAINAIKAELDIVISETTITQVLYADKGNILELTVDQLDTSNKAQKYLNNDTSSVHYIKIQGKTIQFIEAVTDGAQTEQLVDRKGRPLYWIDEDHIGTGITYEDTDLPVEVYVYDEFVKLEHLFQLDSVSGYQVPQMIWGAGSGVGDREKGFIYKDDTGLVLEYVTSEGKTYTFRIGEHGVEIPFDPLSGIDLYADGMITHHGASEDMDWNWYKDGDGRITSITNNTLNTTTTITWNAGDKPV